MEIRGLAFLPFLWVLWTISGLYALLTLTIISGHKEQPFISDTGVQYPEKVVYNVVFMVTSIIGAVIAFIQYRFMIIQSEPSEKRYIISQRILYAFAWIVCIGNAVNAFCSVKDYPLAHRIGAGLAFACNGMYNLCQAGFLYKRTFSSRLMCHVRLVAAVVIAVVLVLFTLGMIILFSGYCTIRCEEIIYLPTMVLEYIGLSGLVFNQATNYTDFQHLSLKISRKGVSICLREKTQDPENPACDPDIKSSLLEPHKDTESHLDIAEP